MAPTGQFVWDRKTSVSAGIGVRNRRMASLSSAGSRVNVGRLDPSMLASGKTVANDRKRFPVASVLKNGRASAPPDSSSWAAMEEMFRASGGSL
jgi:hypothetical protein